MDAATLATFESKTIGRQSLRRGRRTLYIRTYNVPYASDPPLPEAGDFMPGETSGACVTADGVNILAVDSKGFVGLRVTVVAQQPVYNNIDDGNMDLAEYFVEASPADDGGQSETSVGNSQYDAWRFEVPAASWAALDDIPARGAPTPAALGGGGTVLSKTVDRESVPGFVVCKLVTGWTVVYFDSLTRVSVRPVTVREKLTVDTSNEPLDGPVEDREEDQRLAVGGDQYETKTYYQITVISVLTPEQMTSVAAAFNGQEGNRNAAAVTLNKVTYAAGSVKFVGLGSETVVASQSPTKSAAYRSIITLMVSASAWRTVVNRYLETRLIQRVPVNEGTTLVGHARIGAWVRTSVAEKNIRGEFDMGAALGLLSGLGEY